MFTLNYEVFNKPEFNSAMNKLATHTEFKNFKTTYNIARIVKFIEQEAVIYNELRIKLLKKHGEENEDKVTFTVAKENIKAFNKEHAEFLNLEFDIERHKINPDELASVALTPNEVAAIESLLNIMEETC